MNEWGTSTGIAIFTSNPITRGGIEQTIRGQFLDSVFLPNLTMTLVVISKELTIHYEQTDNKAETQKGVSHLNMMGIYINLLLFDLSNPALQSRE